MSFPDGPHVVFEEVSQRAPGYGIRLYINSYEYYKSLCNHQLLQVGLLLTTKLSLLFK